MGVRVEVDSENKKLNEGLNWSSVSSCSKRLVSGDNERK